METLPGLELRIDTFSIIDIKYDGPSFEGVMNIKDLGHELLGLEYCIRETFRKLQKHNRQFSQLLENDLVILVEPFQNNCFRKKIKISVIRKVINNLSTKEIAFILSTGTIIAQLIPPTINGIYALIKEFSPKEVQEITESNISPALLKKIGDNVKAELLSNPGFRREVSRIAVPIKEKDDISEIRTYGLDGSEQLVTIESYDKENFLTVGGIQSSTLSEIDTSERSEDLFGRIHAIDVDAPKRQLGFKLNGEGKEIDCHLRDGLSINDYKYLVGKWVYISGIVKYSGGVPKEIEIEDIKEGDVPIKYYTTTPISF